MNQADHSKSKSVVVALVVFIAGLTSIIVSAPAGAAGTAVPSAASFVDSIGVNTHLHYLDTAYGNFTAVKSALGQLGVKNIRDYPVPNSVSAINELGAAGVKLTAIMGVAAPRPWMPYSLDDLYGVVRNSIRGSVAAVEGPNEWDINGDPSWASNLRSYQQGLWSRVKGDPSTSAITVAGPSITWASNAAALGDISSWADWGNVHPYPGGRTPNMRVADDVNASKASNVAGKPVIATETGYHNSVPTSTGHLGTSETAAAVYLPRLYLDYFGLGVPRTFSYELVDQHNNASNPEANFGLFRNDWTPKPAASALGNLTNLLADPGSAFTPQPFTYSIAGSDGNTRSTLLGKRDGSYWLAVWQETSVWDEVNQVAVDPADRPVTVSFGSAGTIRTYSPNAGISATSTSSGASSVAVTSSERVTLVQIVPSSSTTTTAAPTTTTTAAPTTTTTAAPTTSTNRKYKAGR